MEEILKDIQRSLDDVRTRLVKLEGQALKAEPNGVCSTKREQDEECADNWGQHTETTEKRRNLDEATPIPYSMINDILPSYAGADYEDPLAFLRRSADILQRAYIPQEAWVKITTRRFSDAAAEWWGQRSFLETTWSDFGKTFLNRFNGQQVRANLRARLFSETQKRGEDVVTFITRKKLVYQRILPLKEEEVVAVIVELLLPDIRVHLRYPPPVTVEELVMRAELVSQDRSERGLRATIPTSANGESQPANDSGRVMSGNCYRCGQQGHFRDECPNTVQPRETKNVRRGGLTRSDAP